MTLAPTFHPDDPPPRRRRSRVNWPVLLAVLVLAAIVAAFLLRPNTVSDRARDDKIVRVVLPPPLVPPPPPEVQPEETPPEPTPTPMEQPVDNTPPPDAPAEPTAGDNALTARVGAGPSNYGLASGDGSGARIGGRPGGGGGDGFGAYTQITRTEMERAIRGDPALSRGRYTARVLVTVSPDGRIASARLVQGTGDSRRDAALQRILNGLQLSQRPPAGLPAMRIELNARTGA